MGVITRISSSPGTVSDGRKFKNPNKVQLIFGYENKIDEKFAKVDE